MPKKSRSRFRRNPKKWHEGARVSVGYERTAINQIRPVFVYLGESGIWIGQVRSANGKRWVTAYGEKRRARVFQFYEESHDMVTRSRWPQQWRRHLAAALKRIEPKPKPRRASNKKQTTLPWLR